MAINDPKQPNKDNPFLDFTSSIMKMFSGMEQREKVTNDKLDKLIKQMVLYYKLLENSYNKDTVSSKKGRESSLNEDKGFLKLIELMVDLNGSSKKTLDKYVSGQRLLIDEKRELAKFVQDMKEAISENKEQIGIPIKEILKNFKKIVSDEKINDNFKMDLFSFLRDYSEEDLFLTNELKGLLDNSVKTNKLNDEKMISILMELDKNIEYYAQDEKELKTLSFAPYKKMGVELKEANVSLDEVVKLLTENQRSNTKIEGYLEDGETSGGKGKGEDATSALARELKRTTADLVDFGVVMAGKTAALGMADNPALRGASPALFAGSGLLGKGAGELVKNFNPLTDIPKLATAGAALAPIMPYIAGAAGVAAVGVGINAYKNMRKSQGMPTGGKITDTFGAVRGYDKNGKPIIHGALDLAQPYGSPVKSALGGGVVTEVGSDKLSGNFIKLKNPNGTLESFSHLSGANVKLGAKVQGDTVLGATGTTGRVRGVGKGQSVLHYKVRDSKGNPIDPQLAMADYQKTIPVSKSPNTKESVTAKALEGSSKSKPIMEQTLGDVLKKAVGKSETTIWDKQQKFMKDASNIDTTKLALANKGGVVDTTDYENFKNKYNIKNITQDKNGEYKVLASDKKTGELKNMNASEALSYNVNGQNKWVKNPADFMNIANESQAMPTGSSKDVNGGVSGNQTQFIPVPSQTKEKSTRKLKSDNELLNHHIDYGDIN